MAMISWIYYFAQWIKHEWAVLSESCNNEAGIQKPKFWVVSMMSDGRGPLPGMAPNCGGHREQVTSPLGKGLASSPGHESRSACLPSLVMFERAKCWHEDFENYKVIYGARDYSSLITASATSTEPNFLSSSLYKDRHKIRTSWLHKNCKNQESHVKKCTLSSEKEDALWTTSTWHREQSQPHYNWPEQL